jgi:hypothetical protein
MSTARQRCEPGVDEKRPYWLSDPFWSRLNTEPREPQARSGAHSTDLDAVWQRYSAVIRELEMTAAELEAQRNCRE